jgi:DMSO/TMAO reductase YedYZ molybdopterin-dependent catalytic subunit
MGKKSLRTEELEALALRELRKRPHCAGATRVIISPCSEVHPVTGAYWTPTAVHPGISGVEPCQREVWHVCERLGRDYELT